MSEKPTSPTRSLGFSFLVGYSATLVVFFAFLASMRVLDGGLEFWLFACVTLGLVAPVGGLFFQAIHDLFVAWRTQQLQFLDVALLIAICAAFFIAGYISLQMSVKNKVAEIAAVFIGVLIVVYARRKRA